MRNFLKLGRGRSPGIVAVAAALGVFAIAGPSYANPYSVTLTNGSNLTANATFDVVGTNLIVTLTNTSLVDVVDPKGVLTAVFFDVVGVAPLSPTSALLAPGSTVLFDSQPAGGNVGGEWAYGSGLSGLPAGATEGISSSGFGIFGGPNFNGPDLDPPGAVDGLNYGITSAGDNPLNGNAAVTGGVPLIQNSVVFTLGGLSPGFVASAATIHSVSFQYGTDLDEPNVCCGGGPPEGGPVPEGSSLLLCAGGALPLLLGFRAFRRKQAS